LLLLSNHLQLTTGNQNNIVEFWDYFLVSQFPLIINFSDVTLLSSGDFGKEVAYLHAQSALHPIE